MKYGIKCGVHDCKHNSPGTSECLLDRVAVDRTGQCVCCNKKEDKKKVSLNE